MKFIDHEEVSRIFNKYPKEASTRLKELRKLIIDTAEETGDVEELMETIKWGEASYKTKHGSTIRIDWKEKTPDNYYMYFICTTELVSTFRLIFGEELQFENNRAIMLKVSEELPVDPLKRCISLALNYKKIRHLPMLGC